VFLTFEGPEGAGKSTQASRLAASLRQIGQLVVLTYEPGGTALGVAIRALLLDPASAVKVGARAEALLFAAARAQLVEDVIRPALQRGEIVICDRFADSTAAYQGGGRGLSDRDIAGLVDLATSGLEPDLTFLLDLDVATGLRRKSPSKADRLERETGAFHERVRKAYLARAAAAPDRIIVVDGTRRASDLAAEIFTRTTAVLQRLKNALLEGEGARA
jgi:dTMP kinase